MNVLPADTLCVTTDHEAVINCLYRMLDAADRKDWRAVREQFRDSVVLDHDSAAGHAERVSSDSVVASWENAFQRFDMTWHSVTNPLIEIDGERAVVRSRIQALHADFSAQGGDNLLAEWGTYRHEFCLSSRGWRIAAIEYRCLYARGNSGLAPHP